MHFNDCSMIEKGFEKRVHQGLFIRPLRMLTKTWKTVVNEIERSLEHGYSEGEQRIDSLAWLPAHNTLSR